MDQESGLGRVSLYLHTTHPTCAFFPISLSQSLCPDDSNSFRTPRLFVRKIPFPCTPKLSSLVPSPSLILPDAVSVTLGQCGEGRGRLHEESRKRDGEAGLDAGRGKMGDGDWDLTESPKGGDQSWAREKSMNNRGDMGRAKRV